MAGHWFDLQSSWAAASGVDPLPTCCRTFGSCGGPGGILYLVVLLLFFVRGIVYLVLQDRWVLPHCAVRASFFYGSLVG